MSAPSSSTEPAPMIGGRAAGFLGGGLLVGLLVLAIFARVDRERVSTLEKFSETTAVGDNVYYHLPEPLPDPPIVVARLNGQTLAPVSYAKVELRDTRMQAVARDPETRLGIYVSREPLPAVAGAQSGKESYFVKTASNEYLRLHAAP
ncbi:MAG TPA: hypothetical protein VFD27_22250 [Chthoniobacteraceae bacterium]|jgi:hypothetical protein|nr:hypothetical protein [Chthoniobacteraceae bacterium]